VSSGGETQKTASPCGWCGVNALTMVDCEPPTVHQLHMEPAYAGQCVIAPRWRWCCRELYFFAWLGDADEYPAFPGTPFRGGISNR